MPKLKLNRTHTVDSDTGEIEKVKTAPKEPSRPLPATEGKEEEGEGGEGKKKGWRASTQIHVIKEFLSERYSFRYNEVLATNEFFPTYGDTEQEDYEPLEERAKNDLFLEMIEEGAASSIKGLNSNFDLIINSSFVPTFNPISHYFKGLKWDGVPRIEQLVDTLDITKEMVHWQYDGKEYSRDSVELLRAYFPRWLMACIRCGLGQGANNIMFMIQGNQKGAGKTWWLNHLCPKPLQGRYAYEGHIIPDITNRETGQILTKKFWTNIDDQMQTVFHKDAHSIKGVITSEKVTQRKLFKDDMPIRTRITNFVGSVNPKHIFSESNNRRYLMVALNEKNDRPIDHEAYNKIDKEQLWAECWERYKTGERFVFGSNEFASISAWTQKFVLPSQEEEMLLKHFRPATKKDIEEDKKVEFRQSNLPGSVLYMQKTELLAYLQRESGLRLFSRSLGNALDKQGFECISKRVGGGNPRYVVPVVKILNV